MSDHAGYFTRSNYVNIPVNANLMVLDGLSIEADPQIGFLTSAKLEGEDIKNETNKTDISVVIYSTAI